MNFWFFFLNFERYFLLSLWWNFFSLIIIISILDNYIINLRVLFFCSSWRFYLSDTFDRMSACIFTLNFLNLGQFLLYDLLLIMIEARIRVYLEILNLIILIICFDFTRRFSWINISNIAWIILFFNLIFTFFNLLYFLFLVLWFFLFFFRFIWFIL